jgi:F420-non-reducing hydrogenase small subunit
MSDKPKLAIYWASSCGGCEIAVANLHERILDVVKHFDFMFCPCLLDTKKKDIEALPDSSIALTLFNGAIRTAENEEMARLMRRKSQVLVAYGACAQSGGIPALSNLQTRLGTLETCYLNSPTVDNPEGVIPQENYRMPEGDLHLPHFFERVRSLDQIVPVDYYIPGCPPDTEQIWNVLQVFISGQAAPPAGSIVGAGCSSVCEECARERTDKKVTQFRRIWEFVPDSKECLLEQGIVCMGAATRSGCGGQCPEANMPCIGCYGAPEGVYNQGAKMAATLGSILDIDSIRELRDKKEIGQCVRRTTGTVPDLAGVACKFDGAKTLANTDATEGVTES